MSESNDFLRQIVPKKGATSAKPAESQKEGNKKSITEELLLESHAQSNLRKIPLMGHVDSDIYDIIVDLSRKTGKSKSRVVNDILKKALA